MSIDMTGSEEVKIMRLQTQMENIEEKVDEGFKDNKKTNERIEKKIDDFILASEKKFAGMWVEQGAKWVITLIIGSIIVATLALTIKKS